jgi:hypothetical protein
LFLFLPTLAVLPWGRILEQANMPGSLMIPAAHALRSLLALKLFGTARHSHVMSSVLDEGLALFAGLNVTPKRSFLTQYSCRIPPSSYPKLMQQWFDAMGKLGLERGHSFDLDFHTIPFHGADALVEKHYVSKRSRRQKGMLAFLAQDAETRVFCYANGELRKVIGDNYFPLLTTIRIRCSRDSVQGPSARSPPRLTAPCSLRRLLSVIPPCLGCWIAAGSDAPSWPARPGSSRR